ncbi:MAG TPA: hypothetical protein VN765_14715 [Candidatus Acidoferrum sp.]|nr:hypothetical protein [Candidatus Acidoferrum sp.]
MSRHVHPPPPWRFPALVLLLLALPLAASSSLAADLKLEARLIRGANGGAAPVKSNAVDPALAASFRRNFKWTNYYQITNLAAVIPLNQSRDVRLSDRFTLKIKNLGSSKVAVDCLGRGQPVSRGTNTLPCVYCGTNSDDTAWFIHLRSLGDKK